MNTVLRGKSASVSLSILTGLFTFIMLCGVLQYAYAGDGTEFDFRNKTSQEYTVEQIRQNYFCAKPPEKPPCFEPIHLRPDATEKLYLEGQCNQSDDAAIEWKVYSKSVPEKSFKFKLVVTNFGAGRCAKRLLQVNGEYRKIELVQVPGSVLLRTTPTPIFRFTIVDTPKSGTVLNQEGPVGNRNKFSSN